MKKTLLKIKGVKTAFECYLEVHRNGYTRLWFAQDVANEIMRINNKLNGKNYQMHYEGVYDMFIQEEDGNEYIIKGSDIENLHLYPIDKGCRIWSKITIQERGYIL